MKKTFHILIVAGNFDGCTPFEIPTRDEMRLGEMEMRTTLEVAQQNAYGLNMENSVTRIMSHRKFAYTENSVEGVESSYRSLCIE